MKNYTPKNLEYLAKEIYKFVKGISHPKMKDF